MTKGTAWKMAGAGLLVAAAGAGAAFAQAGIPTTSEVPRRNVDPPVASSQPVVSGPVSPVVHPAGPKHKPHRRHAASAALH